MIGSQKNGADRVTKEKGLKSQKEVDEEMLKKRKAQIQALGGSGLIILLVLVAVFLVAVPNQNKEKVTISVGYDGQKLYIVEVLNSKTETPILPVFSPSEPTGYGNLRIYANYTVGLEKKNIGVGYHDFILPEYAGDWNMTVILYEQQPNNYIREVDRMIRVVSSN